MLYFITRALRATKVLEIGHAEGYTAFYLANAVKDNAIRYGVKDPMYYGIDIVKTSDVREALTKHALPNTIFNMDSADLTSDMFGDTVFDLIFQDGAHDTEHVLKEMEVLYPRLRGAGRGYWIFHDCYGPSEEGYHRIVQSDKYQFESCRLWDDVYGISIMRKMEGYKYGKRFWTP
jgi:hypothetical protein